MVSLCLHRAAGPWRLSGRTLRGAAGWIEVLDHPMVHGRAIQAGDRLGVSILERPHTGARAVAVSLSDADERSWSELRQQTQTWPLHWFWIEADARGLTIQSSPRPTVPLFLTARDGTAHGHWDPLRLLPFLPPRLNWEWAAHYLCTFERPYSPATVLADLLRLPGGYEACWRADEGDWRWVAPPSSPPTVPRLLRPGADPVRTFESLTSAAAARLAGAATRVAAELSGGLDSTFVAGTLARHGLEVRSLGVLVPGEEGAHQRRRRETAIERLGLRDYTHTIAPGYSPWSRVDDESGPREMMPWDELYYVPFDDLYARAAAAGEQLLFTGIGGDELLAPYWDELPDRGCAERAASGECDPPPAFFTKRVRQEQADRARALNDLPRAFVQRSALESAADAAAPALRHGLWPVHPLIEPEVVRYCHSLPAGHRRDRALVRHVLARWGFPRSLSHPAVPESFEGVCTTAMRLCPVFARLLAAPRLADAGFVEPRAVVSAFKAWRAAGLTSSRGLPFVAIATLEAMLECLESRVQSACA